MKQTGFCLIRLRDFFQASVSKTCTMWCSGGFEGLVWVFQRVCNHTGCKHEFQFCPLLYRLVRKIIKHQSLQCYVIWTKKMDSWLVHRRLELNTGFNCCSNCQVCNLPLVHCKYFKFQQSHVSRTCKRTVIEQISYLKIPHCLFAARMRTPVDFAIFIATRWKFIANSISNLWNFRHQTLVYQQKMPAVQIFAQQDSCMF